MTGRRWLLIPMQPTPNGRLHLGHGAGPYLRADVIARALRRDGDHAAVITGSDAYENWVLADGIISGRTPTQTCAIYHAGIESDLDKLGINLETWINPLSPQHSRQYTSLHERLLQDLHDANAASLESEQIPVGRRTGRDIVGVWIAGRCPHCANPCGGNTCTHCGAHFQPEEISEPHSRLNSEPIDWTTRSNWFIRPQSPDRILAQLHKTGLAETFLEPARLYLRQRGGKIRLSQPGQWGITSSRAPAGSVLSNAYYAYSLYCGQIYARTHMDTDHNALDADSNVTVVGLFGTDNSIAGLIAPHVIAGATRYKPFDHTVVNHMLHFDGGKFSTSKNHGIWISELLNNTSITTDELRYCLAEIPLDHQIGDIGAATIANTVNRLRQWRTNTLATALDAANPSPLCPQVAHLLDDTLDRQRRHLTPPTTDLAAAIGAAHEWMFNNTADFTKPDHAYTWLLGTALLIAPIIPTLASEIWTALGLPGSPKRHTLTNHIHGQTIHRSPFLAELTKGITAAEITPYVHLQKESTADHVR